MNRVKLISAIFGANRDIFREVEEKLLSHFGDIDMRSDTFKVDNFTNYYQREMGNNLLKYFISFSQLVDRGELANIKLIANKIENIFKVEDKRIVNIDPGIITMANLTLASTKDYSHRIYIGSGIFAEITLIYNRGFKPLEWTYPDYKTDMAISFFERVRGIYKEQLKHDR